MKKSLLIFAAALLAPLAALHAADSDSTYAQIARPHPRANGAPKASDVCFSTRWPRPTNPSDTHDSFKSALEFHATRLDWLYLSGRPSDEEFVSKAKALDYPVGGTLNSNLSDSPASKTHSIGRTVNMKGGPLKDPWSTKYRARFGCPNSPDYAKVFLDHARYALDAGVDHFQMDGVQLNDIMLYFGGCFCAHCIKGFREYLDAHSTPAQRTQWGITDLAAFDYAAFLLGLGTAPDAPISAWRGPKELRDLFHEFQVESGLRFLGDMHNQIDQMAGRKLAYSCNANEEFLTTYYKIHDFALIESYPFKEGVPAFLYEQRLKPGRELGKSYLLTFVSNDVEHNRRFIAWAYALGSNVIVPWDVFTGFDTPRFFGAPDQFSDLFGFVRANASLLDGYEEAGVFGPGIRDPRYSDGQPPLQVYAASPVLAVVRAKPGQPDAPVVVHLAAATADRTGPIRLTLDPKRFFGGRPLKMRFLAPPPYAAAEHEKARGSGDFAPLSRTTELPGGRVSVAELPCVDPWGILVVEPGDGTSETPWQPAVWCEESTRFGDTIEVRLDCPTRGAEIGYTLDGSEPTKTADLYSRPLHLDASATVKAKAFGADGPASPAVSARFERSEARPRLTPDAPALKDALKLWLKADTLAATLKDGAPVKIWPAEVGPEAVLSSNTLLSGAAAGTPTFGTTVLNGHPGVRFDGMDDQMVIPGFANACLAGKPFTVVLVTQSKDSLFGICGNASNGSGGIPRLYLTRGTFSYDRMTDSVPVGAGPAIPAVTVYQHDGQKTASARVNGRLSGKRDDLPLVKEFGGGGNLAMPFWSGHLNHPGELGEIIAYDRQLTNAEIEAVEEDIAVRYGIGAHLRWR